MFASLLMNNNTINNDHVIINIESCKHANYASNECQIVDIGQLDH
jgi:hypothetical protein